MKHYYLWNAILYTALILSMLSVAAFCYFFSAFIYTNIKGIVGRYVASAIACIVFYAVGIVIWEFLLKVFEKHDKGRM